MFAIFVIQFARMKPLILIIIFLTIGCLIACEANKHVFVQVYDKVSMKPLDSVHVVIKAGKNGDYTKSGSEGYTDAAGRFDTHFMIGCSFGCYDVFLECHKKGYKSTSNFNPKDSSLVYLER